MFLAGCGDDTSKKTASATNAPARYDSGQSADGYRGIIWGRWCRRRIISEKVIDVAYINQGAIQLFNASEGRMPKRLE